MQKKTILGTSAFIVFITVCWGLLLGKDLSWDVLNHHVYLPFSWWTGRIDQDLFGAGPQSYQNPLGYFIFYGLLATGLPAIIIGVLLSALHSLNGVFLLLISLELWSENCKQRLVWVILGTAMAMAAPIYMQSVGTSSVDPISSILVLAALWMALRLFNRDSSRVIWVSIGCCLGIAFSIKQSNAVFVISVGLVLLMAVSFGRVSAKVLLFSMFGGLLGLFAGMGWYSAYLFNQFGNPVFPLFNNIFNSPYYPNESVIAGRFMAHEVVDYFVRLINLAEMRRLVYFEGFMPDVRLLLLVCMVAVVIFLWLMRKIAKKPCCYQEFPAKDIAILVFVVFSYILWMLTSGNGRYAIPLFLVVGIALVRVSFIVLPFRVSKIVTLILLIGQVGYTVTAADLRFVGEPWDDKAYFKVKVTDRLAREPFLHVSVGTLSYSFLVDYFEPEGALINLAGQYSLPIDGPLGEKVDTLLDRWQGRTRLLGNAVDLNDAELVRSSETAVSYMLYRYGLTVDFSDCDPITMDRKEMSSNPFNRWIHKHNQFINAEQEFSLFSCALVPVESDGRYEVGEALADKVFDIIENACPKLYGPTSWVSERSPEFWWRFYANTDAIVKVYEDQVIVQQPRSPIDRVLGSPSEILEGKGFFDCSNWDMMTPK